MTNLATYSQPQARELTEDEHEVEIEQAFQLSEELKAAVQDVKRSWWRMARACYLVREEHVWVKLGYELEEYLGDADIGLKPSQFYDLAKLWDELRLRGIEREEVEQIDQTKVRIVLGALKTNRLPTGDLVTRDEVMADLKTLSRGDIIEKYRKRSTPAMPDSEPEVEPDTPEPIRGDQVDDEGGILSPAELEASLANDEPEVLVGEVIETKQVITAAQVRRLLNVAHHALDSEASFPRVKRELVEVFVEVVEEREALRATLASRKLQLAVEDLARGMDTGAEVPGVHMSALKTIRQLLDLLGVD